MVDTIKFSEFVDGGDLEPNQVTVGLEASANTRFTNAFPLLPPGSTGDRPAIAASMYYRLRFNTTLESYEYYSPIEADWIQLEDSTDISILLALLASHLAGEGASLIGLQNQGTIVDKTVQDLANASIVANTDNGTLVNGQFLEDLTTGIVKNTTGTGLLSILTGSSTITAVINDNTMATAATTNLPTSLAIKTYVDNSIAGAVTSGEGTANQVLVNGTSGTPQTGDLIFTTPQDIGTSSSPTFFNLMTNNVYGGVVSILSTGGTTTLTINSPRNIFLTGVLTETIRFPDATTLPNGWEKVVLNNTTQDITIEDFTIGPILILSPDTTGILTLTDNSTSNGIWAFSSASTSFPLNIDKGGTGTDIIPANGQLLIGNGTSYSVANLTAGTGVSITNGLGSITIDATGGGLSWTTTAGTTQAIAVNNGYVSGNAAQSTFTLPATAAVGDRAAVEGLGAGGWILAANTGQTIKIGSSTTSSAGTLTSAAASDNVYVICIVANTTWRVQTTNSAGLTVA